MRSHQVINSFWQWFKEGGNISIRTNIPCCHTIFRSCRSTSFHGLPDSTSAKYLPVPFHGLTRKLANSFGFQKMPKELWWFSRSLRFWNECASLLRYLTSICKMASTLPDTGDYHSNITKFTMTALSLLDAGNHSLMYQFKFDPFRFHELTEGEKPCHHLILRNFLFLQSSHPPNFSLECVRCKKEICEVFLCAQSKNF